MSRTSEAGPGSAWTSEISVRTPKEFFDAVRARIDTPEKWFKGDWGARGYDDHGGQMCLGRAICGIQYLGPQDPDRLLGMLVSEVPAKYPRDGYHGIGALAEFNDDPEVTHADMMALFDRVEARLGEMA